MQLHNAVAEMEKEKFELQKQHTETIQELLEDTNVRLNKMEGEYMVQTQSTVSIFLFSVSLFTSILRSISSFFTGKDCTEIVTKFKEKAFLSYLLQ